MINILKKIGYYSLIASGLLLTSCDDDDDDDTPAVENEVETITDVTLKFIPSTGTDTVTASAKDPDGTGVEPLTISDTIMLKKETTYTLMYDIKNALADPVEDIGAEISEEKDEHQIFYGFSQDVFSNPAGDGNIGSDAKDDPMNYGDTDNNSLPVGLETTWTTGSVASNQSFRVLLKHQPNLKNSTSTSETGDTDFDLTFVLQVVD